jgi:hypothetical protein
MSDQTSDDEITDGSAAEEPLAPGLGTVFGQLDDATREAVQAQLDAASGTLAELAAALGERSGRTWQTSGAAIEVYESGQAMVAGSVKDGFEGITFALELRPGNFFDDARPWRPGEAPRPMATDAWDVEGEALVLKVTRVSGRKYTIQESAAELEEQRFTTPESAAAAFASYATRLAELALSREPVAASWQSDIDEIGTAPGQVDEWADEPGVDSPD